MAVGWQLIDHEHESWIEMADYAILAFFVVELLIRLWQVRFHPRFFKSGWNVFDTLVLIAALLPFGTGLLALRLVRVARFTHLGRHLLHLRIVELVRRSP